MSHFFSLVFFNKHTNYTGFYVHLTFANHYIVSWIFNRCFSFSDSYYSPLILLIALYSVPIYGNMALKEF